MSKIPNELKVKFTVSDIAVEVPKTLFENAAIKVAVFFGRKGKSALTQRTKWFTVADPSSLPSSTRQMVALPPVGEDKLEGSTRRASTTKVGGDSAENSLRQVHGELVVLNFSGLNNAVYDTELKPLNKFDNEWVFDHKSSHPLTVFAKILIKMRQGAKGNAAKSEQESNLNEMLQMDQSEMEGDYSSGDDGAKDPNEASVIDIDGVELTADQLALLTDGKSENELLIEALKEGRDCKKRYLTFPKAIDLGSVANTRAKRLEFSERLNCKSASLLGSVISFSITAAVDESTLEKYETKKKDHEDKEERKRREKEEKILEKERKKQEKTEAKERKKRGENQGSSYGADVTDMAAGDGAASATEASNKTAPEHVEKQKGGFLPFTKIKSLFTHKKDTQTTPFPVKMESSPYPYLFLLDKFVLRKLVMPPNFYRGVHIRLGCDPIDLDGYPKLLLNTETKSYLKEEAVTGYDGQPKNVFKFDFGSTHVYFADKHIRNVTGFDTIRALSEHEKEYIRAKKLAAEGIEADEAAARQNSNELFHAEILNVGEKFLPMAFQSTKYSAHGAQVESTKFTRVTAQLLIPKEVKNVNLMTDEDEKKAYIKKIKAEQRRLKKEEKARIKAEKKAAKAKSGAESSSDDEEDSEDNSDSDVDDVPTENGERQSDASSALPPAVEHVSPNNSDAEKKDADEANGEGEAAFESGGADKTNAEADAEIAAAAAAAAEPKASDESRFSLNKSRSFQLGFHLINEENIPADGITYAIRFETGEELLFRARRVYLPSISPVGDAGATKEDKTLLDFSPNA